MPAREDMVMDQKVRLERAAELASVSFVGMMSTVAAGILVAGLPGSGVWFLAFLVVAPMCGFVVAIPTGFLTFAVAAIYGGRRRPQSADYAAVALAWTATAFWAVLVLDVDTPAPIVATVIAVATLVGSF